jgi:hypothetical protein
VQHAGAFDAQRDGWHGDSGKHVRSHSFIIGRRRGAEGGPPENGRRNDDVGVGEGERIGILGE